MPQTCPIVQLSWPARTQLQSASVLQPFPNASFHMHAGVNYWSPTMSNITNKQYLRFNNAFNASTFWLVTGRASGICTKLICYVGVDLTAVLHVFVYMHVLVTTDTPVISCFSRIQDGLISGTSLLRLPWKLAVKMNGVVGQFNKTTAVTKHTGPKSNMFTTQLHPVELIFEQVVIVH